jgi:Vacuolar sorting-associated protein 13, N-terminal
MLIHAQSTLQDLERWEALYRQRPPLRPNKDPKAWWKFLVRCVTRANGTSSSSSSSSGGWLKVRHIPCNLCVHSMNCSHSCTCIGAGSTYRCSCVRCVLMCTYWQLLDSHCTPYGFSVLQVARLLGQRRRYVALFKARAQHMATPEDYQVYLLYNCYNTHLVILL